MRKGMTGIAALGAAGLLLALGLAGCQPPGPSPVSHVVPAFAKGSVAAKGSVWVNGIEYDTTGATITINGAPGTDADLKVGMQVNVDGTIDTSTNLGTATAVEYKNSMEGLVDSVDSVHWDNLTVLGQTVKVNVATRFDSDDPATPVSALNDIWAGDVVEIAAVPDGSGSLVASYVCLKVAGPVPGTTPLEVDGTVSGLDRTAHTFTLTPASGSTAPIAVSYTIAVADLASTVVNGSVVEIQFTAADYSVPAGSPAIGPIASGGIELKVELQPSEGDITSVEGAITALDATAKTLTVQGIAVDAGAIANLSSLSNNLLVEVHGTWSNGKLVAGSIDLK